MLHPTYPNLELLEYKVRQALSKNDQFCEALKAARERHKYAAVEFEVDMFPQMWGTTSLGFDIMEDGSPSIGGQAFTAAYTSVFHEKLTDTYVVCFGSDICYQVVNPTEAFWKDLKEHRMASLSQAKKLY